MMKYIDDNCISLEGTESTTYHYLWPYFNKKLEKLGYLNKLEFKIISGMYYGMKAREQRIINRGEYI